MVGRFARIWKPEMYHGESKTHDYFEGWYYKLVDESGKHVYSIIPGVSMGREKEDHHAFIQVFNGRTGETWYHSYPLHDFRSSSDKFHVNINSNAFSLDSLHLAIQDDQQSVHGDLKLDGIQSWPITRFSPGAMGYFAFLPFMQTYHGILAFDPRITGSLTFDDHTIDFTGGRGYIEKDWGREFPQAWIWMQSNHFDVAGISLTASIATVPWLGFSFTGYIIGFLYEGRIYRFTTYNRANLENLQVSPKEVTFQIRSKNHKIIINATRTKGGRLRSPIRGSMIGRIVETLTARINLQFYETQRNRQDLLFEGTGYHAGLEVVGDMQKIGASSL